jgi:hypothetical protein
MGLPLDATLLCSSKVQRSMSNGMHRLRLALAASIFLVIEKENLGLAELDSNYPPDPNSRNQVNSSSRNRHISVHGWLYIQRRLFRADITG